MAKQPSKIFHLSLFIATPHIPETLDFLADREVFNLQLEPFRQKTKRLISNGGPALLTDQRQINQTLPGENTARVRDYVREHASDKEIRQKDIAKALGMTGGMIWFHLDKLEKAGEIAKGLGGVVRWGAKKPKSNKRKSA